MKKAILGTLLVSLTSIYSARVYGAEAQEPACLDKAQSTVEMYDCIANDLKVADEKLNQAFQKLISSFDITKDTLDFEKESLEAKKRRLIQAEKDWIAFRDSDCEFAGSTMYGGTGEKLIVMSCLLGRTEERLSELQHYYEEFQGE